MGKKLNKKVAIITGATSGMGAAIARLFASEGASVVVAGRNADNGNKVVEEIRAKSGTAIFVEADISGPEGNVFLIEEALREFKFIDIVIHSAGILGLGSITELSAATWHQTINTNLNSVFYLLRLAIPEMQKRSAGNIIIIGSIAAQKAFPNHPAYCASKGALVPLVKQIALDYSPDIRVNLIHPGPIDTPMIWDSTKAFPNPAQAVQEAGKATLVGRLGQPEEIAKAALFLATDESSFITGSTIIVDGGITVK